MNVYEFRANGVALSSVIIVVANSRATANELAEEWLKEQELSTESLYLHETNPLPTKSAILYAWDGDY
jgi:hypothetical protein